MFSLLKGYSNDRATTFVNGLVFCWRTFLRLCGFGTGDDRSEGDGSPVVRWLIPREVICSILSWHFFLSRYTLIMAEMEEKKATTMMKNMNE